MTTEALLDKISKLRQFHKEGKRAPHKPILLLYALGQWQLGNREINWAAHEENLNRILVQFSNNGPTMENPFVRLTNDANGSLWELTNYPNKDGYTAKQLRDAQATAKFSQEVQQVLQDDPMALHDLAAFILDKEFPLSLHEDILSACGIMYQPVVLSQKEREKRKRDPNFREKVLTAYERKCAICGYDVRLGDQLIGLEAAHIQWHNKGGPDITTNGIALCALHHKMVDFGLLGFSDAAELLVSKKGNGTSAFTNQVLQFEHKTIFLPRFEEDQPNPDFFAWQREEVFRG
jgi:putative restriction endonuclease